MVSAPLELLGPPINYTFHSRVTTDSVGNPLALLSFSLFAYPTCQGYSLTSVSTPPTILVILFAKPQLQLVVSVVVVLLLGDTVDDMDEAVDVFVKAK